MLGPRRGAGAKDVALRAIGVRELTTFQCQAQALAVSQDREGDAFARDASKDALELAKARHAAALDREDHVALEEEATGMCPAHPEPKAREARHPEHIREDRFMRIAWKCPPKGSSWPLGPRRRTKST